MPLSKDPDLRSNQLANLRPAGATTHGATAEGTLAPLRAKHRLELLKRFPGIDEHRLSLLSDLLARIDRARDFIDANGLMKNGRQMHPLLEQLARWERRAWDMLSQLSPKRSSAAGGWDRDTPTLQIVLTTADRIGLIASDEETRRETVHRILLRISNERKRGKATSLRRTSLNMQSGGQPPEKLNVRDLSDADLGKLEELVEQVAAESGDA